MDTCIKAIDDVVNGRPVSVKIYEMDDPDVLLWAVWCIQQYSIMASREGAVKKYGKTVYDIINFISLSQNVIETRIEIFRPLLSR